jgi:quinol monooxygenase YgiN
VPVYQTAHYQVKADVVEKVKVAIKEFVRHVKANEPGTMLYTSWQEKDDPTRFVHLFIFENEAAHEAHGQSSAVKAFEAVYSPELVGGPVTFTDYLEVASNS